MADITPLIQQYTVDFASNNNFVFVKGVQSDGYQTRYVDITLMNNGQPYEVDAKLVRAVIRGTKPDGAIIFNECEILDSNTIRVEITPQMAAVSGKSNYEISIMSLLYNQALTSFPFYIVISQTSFEAEDVTSSNEFLLLVKKINQVDRVNEQSNYLVEQQKELKVELEKTIDTAEAVTADSRSATSALRTYHNEVKNAEAARVTAENTRKSNEDARIAAENTRQSNEETRKSNEETRKSNETQRITNENVREANEAQRIANENVREENENTRKENETARQDAESVRVGSENQRIADEETRQSNEEARIQQSTDFAEAETIREENEKIRQSNEEIRKTNESARVEAENIRISNENQRKTDENIRISNENKRIANENARIQQANDFANAESIRVTNENARITAENNRVDTENIRVSSENQRNTNEDTRKSAENTRISNEEIRQQQEAERQANTSTAIANAEEATKNANDVIGIVLGAIGINDNPTEEQAPFVAYSAHKVNSLVNEAKAEINEVLDDHIANTENPHEVTKEQIGLGNVDNTADADKSVKHATSSDSAEKLSSAVTVQTNLGSTSAASFDGSENITPGITGVLPVANGGTGNSSVDTTPTSGSTKMVTSGGVYTALSGKQATINGGASTITSSNLTASRALVSNANGKVAVSAVTSTELGYLTGVTSAIQTQLNGKAASSHNQAASTITAGTLAGKVLANATSVKTLNDKQVRNIFSNTTSVTAGAAFSGLADGDIYLQYE